MIKQKITDQIKDAMRSKDSVKLETLRYILSQLKYSEIDKKRELTDEESISILSTEVKKRKDAIKLFRDGGREQLALDEEEKLKTITSLLPEQLSRGEIEKLVDQAIAKVGKGNMGNVMRELMPHTKGRADGSLVSQIVKEKISQ